MIVASTYKYTCNKPYLLDTEIYRMAGVEKESFQTKNGTWNAGVDCRNPMSLLPDWKGVVLLEKQATIDNSCQCCIIQFAGGCGIPPWKQMDRRPRQTDRSWRWIVIIILPFPWIQMARVVSEISVGKPRGFSLWEKGFFDLWLTGGALISFLVAEGGKVIILKWIEVVQMRGLGGNVSGSLNGIVYGKVVLFAKFFFIHLEDLLEETLTEI